MSDTVQQLLGDGSALAYVALFFGILLENAGVPLPGETALLIAGYLSCESGGNVLAPILIHQVDPVYPEAMRRAHEEGLVVEEELFSTD